MGEVKPMSVFNAKTLWFSWALLHLSIAPGQFTIEPLQGTMWGQDEQNQILRLWKYQLLGNYSWI